ncbi:MAG: lysylphosphatidylglycerol synthase transmembrane domain-containing protein [Candidatus Saccharicenans sp.]|nr:lysylphosphatidylglycerol synthase transmembrane domain-containing protein [Candidatus Saccharicenans sp.]MDI6849877.1 lysylphosphatidylglycerol synthase transmembrane domain-containing protein [Candidatus Saccharicenans sp.]
MTRSRINYLVIFLLTAVFLYFFFKSVHWDEVWRYLGEFKLPFLVLTVCLGPLHLVTRSIRWKFLLHPVKPDLRFGKAVEATTVGFTVTLLFPARVGEVVRPIYLARAENMSPGYLMGTIVVERAFDLFTNCFLLGTFLLTRPFFRHNLELQPETLGRLFFWGRLGLGLAVVLFSIIVTLYFMKDRAAGLFRFIGRPFPARVRPGIEKLGREFIEGLKFFHSFWRLLGYFGLSLVVWLGISLLYWVFYTGYGLKIPYFFIVPYIFLTMIGASIPTPGMAGGFDYFSKLALTGLYGMDPDRAVGLTIVIHSLQFVVTCLLGYVILWRNGLSLFQARKMGEGQS